MNGSHLPVVMISMSEALRRLVRATIYNLAVASLNRQILVARNPSSFRSEASKALAAAETVKPDVKRILREQWGTLSPVHAQTGTVSYYADRAVPARARS
jgi:hypothetical protein